MRFKLLSFTLFFLFPLMLSAHGSHGTGIMAGFTHPIFGIDHAIAILGIGFLGYTYNDTKWYMLFLPFIVLMIIGGFLGIGNEATYLIEKVIASSVFLVGLFVLLRHRSPLTIIMLALAIFGFFHGYAHGAEMPADNQGLIYVCGFTLGALLMYGVGAMLAKSISSINGGLERNTSLASGILMGCGIMILLG